MAAQYFHAVDRYRINSVSLVQRETSDNAGGKGSRRFVYSHVDARADVHACRHNYPDAYDNADAALARIARNPNASLRACHLFR